MSARTVWGVGVSMLVAVAGGGCGTREDSVSPSSPEAQDSSNSAPSPAPDLTPAPTPGPVPTPPPDPAPVLPPSETPPDASGGHVDPELTPFAFEVPACVPVSAPTGPRHPHPCATKTYGPEGSLTSIEHWAADAQGRKLREELYLRDNPLAYDSKTWSYDAAGRVARIDGVWASQRYLYDEQGHLVRVELFKNGQDTVQSWERYLYSSQGQLVRIVYAAHDYCYAGPQDSEPNCGLYAFKDLAYHATGQIKRESYEHFSMYDQDYPSTLEKEYDTQGHLVSASESYSESVSTTTWAYDAQGQRMEEHRVAAASFSSSDQHTRWLYDEEGRTGARRIVQDWERNASSSSPGSGRRITIDRFLYSCGNGDLLLREQDTDQDGVRNGWRELTRDAAGNLLVDAYHGSLISESRVSRIEYDYSCYE